MHTFAKEVSPHLRRAEDSFAESLNQLRAKNLETLEQTSHAMVAQLYQGIQWKVGLTENLRRINESVRKDPEHPLNSKLRRKLLT